MKFIIIDNFRNQQDRDKLVDALQTNFGEVVVLSLGELHDFQNLASQLNRKFGMMKSFSNVFWSPKLRRMKKQKFSNGIWKIHKLTFC